jgi:hypothetical protein
MLAVRRVPAVADRWSATPLRRSAAAAWLLLLGLIFAMAPHAGAADGKLPPADEAAGDVPWSRFKARLLEAADRRDQRFLMRVLDPNVRNGPGNPAGVTEFRRQWQLDQKQTGLWRELQKLLFLGGRYIKSGRGKTEFCAPYVSLDWPDELDRYEHGAIVSKEALVVAQPSSESATLATLSYDIVRVLDWDVADRGAASPQRWVKVQVSAGEGYVPEQQIRSPVEFQACFVNTAAGWRISAIFTGE